MVTNLQYMSFPSSILKVKLSIFSTDKPLLVFEWSWPLISSDVPDFVPETDTSIVVPLSNVVDPNAYVEKPSSIEDISLQYNGLASRYSRALVNDVLDAYPKADVIYLVNFPPLNIPMLVALVNIR